MSCSPDIVASGGRATEAYEGNSKQYQFVPLENIMRVGVPKHIHAGGILEQDATHGNHISVRTHDDKSWKFAVEDVKTLKEIVMPVFATGTDEYGAFMLSRCERDGKKME